MAAKPPATDYRAVIRQLIALWDANVDLQSIERDPEVPAEVLVIVRGIVAHAVDCARGVLTLYQASQPVAAAPLIRTVMEDAITAGWVLVIPEGWKQLVSNGSRTRALVLAEALLQDPDDERTEARRQEYEEQVKQLGKPTRAFTSFEQRLNAIEGTGSMYSVYRYLSALTHAGAETANLYTVPNPDSPYQTSYRTYAAHPMAGLLLLSAASSLLHALTAWDDARKGHPNRDALNAIAAELGIDNAWSAKAP
jgi:hypothetical protein